MGRLASTLALLVVFVGLMGYIYFVDRTRPAGEPRDEVFASVSAEEIEEVEIQLRDGDTSRVRRVGDAWRLVEPEEADADRTELSSIASALSSLARERVVDEDASDLAQYGLDPARIAVAFRTAGDEDARRLLLGERSPTGGEVYARLDGDRRVFLVASYLESTFDKSAFALRDKAILRFDEAQGLELTSGTTALAFAKDGADWRLVKPIAARADFSVVESAIQRLASAQMLGIVAADADDLRTYGLDRPTATITVRTEGEPATLTLGRTDQESALVFAKDASRPAVFTVAPTLHDDVIKDVSDYRRKDLFDARVFTATHIELRRGDDSTVIEKAAADDGANTWRDGAGADVDTAAAEDLLSKTTFLRADSFDATAHTALRSPELTIVIQFGENRAETVTFARAGSDVVAARTDEPGSARVDPEAFDEVLEALDALR